MKPARLCLGLLLAWTWTRTSTSQVLPQPLLLPQEEIVSVSEVTVLQDAVAYLPCSLHLSPGDQLALVLWFKDGGASPIYSLDMRSSVMKASHWADDRALGGRAFFRAAGNASHLALERVQEPDAGSFRCRIDFSRSPTRNSIVNLQVIVPPENLTILNERGAVAHMTVGPYSEGSTPEVTCVVHGGRPRPRISWLLDGRSLGQGQFQQQASVRRVSSVMRLPRLTRRNFNSELVCRALNHQQPLSASVTLDMILSPLSTRLLGDNKPLSAGKTYEVACESVGSRPPANITWWRDAELQREARETTSADANMTTSVLQLTPRVQDSGRRLCCHAVNPRLDASAVRDCWMLFVRYSPIVSLELGSSLNASAIKEGSDVYFECGVRADPWIRKIVWRHNGRQLQGNASAGLLLSNQTLVLQAVSRNSSGLYTCLASNSEGDTESNPLNLDVKYAPECVPGQQRIWGAARRESISIPCLVDSRPPATLFHWTFNSSSRDGGSAIPSSVTTQPGRSVAAHTPLTEKDYGTLTCLARNDLGVQLQPCVFVVVPAGRPDAPHDCRVVSRAATSLHAVCTRGSDGGLPPQQFTLELFSGRRLVANVTSRTGPEFTLPGLEPDTSYRIVVYASNGKGRSANTATLNVATLSSSGLSKQRFDSDSPPFPIVVLLLAGVVVALVLVGIPVLCIALRMRRSRLQGAAQLGKLPPTQLSADDNPDVVPNKEEVDASYTSLKEKVHISDRCAIVEGSPTPTPVSVATKVCPSHIEVEEALVSVSESKAWAPRRQDAGTQTPRLLRHKESAV